MARYLRLIAFVVVCAMATASTGCSSMRTIKPGRPGAPVFGNVKAGDTVQVRTHDGRSKRFVVQQVDAENLVAADGTRYTRPEIARLQRQSFSLWKTGLMVGGTVMAGLVAFMAVIVSDEDFGKWY